MPNIFFSKLVTRIKAEEFIISPEIPFNYIFMTFVKRGLMYFRGFLLFRRLNSKIYVGKNVTIKCLSKINTKPISKSLFIIMILSFWRKIVF